jgi:outer membrane protein insertion porin family
MYAKYLKINAGETAHWLKWLGVFAFLLIGVVVFGQTDTTITSIDPELENIFKQRIPQEYEIASVTVTGNNFFDNSLLTSIANITPGDKIRLPGDDIFSKAIQNLWKQNYFSDATIYITKLEKPNKLHIEIAVVERPRLGKFTFKGIKKSETEDVQEKTGLVAGRNGKQ